MLVEGDRAGPAAAADGRASAASPYVLLAGPVIVRVAWAALLIVTGKATEVVAL